jgi:hypothetical protein
MRDIWAGLTLDLFARPNTTADVRAAVAAAIQPLMKGMTNMALNLDKLTADVARVKDGVAALRTKIDELSAANNDPAVQGKIDDLDQTLTALVPDTGDTSGNPAPAPAAAPVA